MDALISKFGVKVIKQYLTSNIFFYLYYELLNCEDPIVTFILFS